MSPLCVHLWGVLGVLWVRWGVLRGSEEALTTLVEKHPVRFLMRVGVGGGGYGGGQWFAGWGGGGG